MTVAPAPAYDIVRSARARQARLSVDPASGRVRLTVPQRAPLGPAVRWAEEKRDWIAQQRARLPAARPFVPGAIVPFGDGTLTIDWDPAWSRTVRREGDRLQCGGPHEGLARRVAQWLQREALSVLTAETRTIAATAGVTVTQVAVGDPTSRWGSCAAHGAIRYSWRLILAPDFVRRSTVAHEVAHRVHMNHGTAFHRLAATLSGVDEAAVRSWFRRHGAALHWVGRAR